MPRRYWWLPGGITAGLLLAVGLGPLIALLAQAPLEATPLWRDPYLRQVVFFSLGQAALSTGLSLLLALPVSRALHRRRFVGRSLLLRLFGLSQVLPVIIALFGLVAVHGHGGWLARLLVPLGLSLPQYLYGLSGIVLAHLFFNVPLAARWWLQSLERLPANQWRLAEQLGLAGWSLFRHLEWPALRAQLPALAGLIFMLCFTSFATVMALGGGPGATTLEVAIYQALRYDFDLHAAGQLALWQLLLSGLILLLHHRWPSEPPQLKVSDHYRRQDGACLGARLHDGASLALVALLYLPPLLAILLSGLRPELWRALASPRLWHSTGQSLLIGTLAASLALGLTLLLLTSSRHLRLRLGRRHWAQGLESLGNLILVLPSAVLSTGLFILLMPFTDVFGLGLYLVVLINALASLPYTLRTLQPAMEAVAHRYDRLADSLGLAGLARITRLEWPLLRPALGRAFALAMILSLGDLGAIALFGSGELQTLPWLLYQQLGSYRLNEAAATALLLLALCLALLGLLERGIGGKDADCR
ncbi:thiamine/thiamine pyrophosphate ABC transporter permease [Pseudaeromonas sp. ZJS20]|uniref:thiamine/thiamine pyrophosphate ABC transporter permease n=1 Tax=Pseudaeromonas aegiceratis TaxID=3153928 RepID=UPI00390C7D39